MNKIGFTNFRRFQRFEQLPYSNITFLVGRNNSGKSTMVKALLLVLEYLKSENSAKFSFGGKNLENANIVTFGRAKNKNASEKKPISFEFTLENHEIDIVVTGNNDLSIVDVETLKIKDALRGIDFEIKPRLSVITLSLKKSYQTIVEEPKTEYGQLSFLNDEIQRLETQIEKSPLKKSSLDYIRLIQELEKVKKKRNFLAHSSEPIKSVSGEFVITTEYHSVSSMEKIIRFAIDESRNMSFNKFKSFSENKHFNANELKNAYGNYLSFQESREVIEDSIDELEQELSYLSTYYLASNPAKQSTLLNIRDSNNTLAQAVHDYYQLLENRTDNEAFRFIIKWMSNNTGFEIGESFEIKLQAGEAYEVQINTHGAIIPLADKGMGSIQAMLLLFRLATIIYKTKRLNYKPIVIIEEPELNLHPALQSKLCDLFLEVHERYDIDLIVETHSEYIIRKTQLFVKEREYEHKSNENPFTTIYFDKDLFKTYSMKYRDDGKFENEFGKGFYDEASNLTINLF
jgi:predicted ATPase